MPNLSLQFRRTAQFVLHVAVDGERLGSFYMSPFILQLPPIAEQLGQDIMSPKYHIVPIERGCDSEADLIMAKGLLSPPLEVISKRDIQLFKLILIICDYPSCVMIILSAAGACQIQKNNMSNKL
jgi:hypothetical protein